MNGVPHRLLTWRGLRRTGLGPRDRNRCPKQIVMGLTGFAHLIGLTPLTGLAPLPSSASLTSAGPSRAANPLAGSAWQLVALQSMDDAIGRQTPKDPAAYTLRFGADGMALMRLDCNRGRASWRASAAAPSQGTAKKDVSGSLHFGPLALTRALCPAPSLSATVARQLPFVRSFLLRNNRLYLSLLADGGILEWRPLPGVANSGVSTSKVLTPEERRAILAGLDPASRQALAQDPNQHRALVARIDLNGDGRQELFAYLMGPLFCGSGGCTLQLLTPESASASAFVHRSGAGAEAGVGAAPHVESRSGKGAGWRLVQTFAITRQPLIVAPTSSGRWRDFWRLESGGGAPRSLVRERFDGQRYRPAERRPAQPIPAGTVVLAGDPSLTDGAPL